MAEDESSGGSELSEYRSLLAKTLIEQSQECDKSILSLAGGALGVSFLFIKDLIPNFDKSTLWLLVAGWILMVVSLLSTLVSMWTSRWAFEKAIEQIDKGEIHSQEPGAWYTQLTYKLNGASIICFIIGVVFLLMFAVANYLR
jgi:hypothetical protein